MVKLTCSICGHNQMLTQSTISQGVKIKRHHRCKNCGTHLTTIEISKDAYKEMLKQLDDYKKLMLHLSKLADSFSVFHGVTY